MGYLDFQGYSSPYDVSRDVSIDLLSDLVGYYRFDGNLNDQSGLNHLTSSGAVLGAGGGAASLGRLDGGMAHIPTTLSIPVTEMTFAYWLAFTGKDPLARIASCQLKDDDMVVILNCEANRIGPELVINSVGGSSFSIGLVSGLWHHIAVVFDNGILRIYSDGVLVNTGVHVPLTTVGGWQFEASSDYIMVDDPAIYTRVLTPAEIAKLATYQFDPTA